MITVFNYIKTFKMRRTPALEKPVIGCATINHEVHGWCFCPKILHVSDTDICCCQL